jgi:hypothetical protein
MANISNIDQQFSDNPTRYMNSPYLVEFNPMRVVVTGVPLSGTSSLASSLANKMGIPFISFESELEALIRRERQSLDLAKHVGNALLRGHVAASNYISKLLRIFSLRTPCGAVFEGIIPGKGAGWAPDLVVECDLSESQFPARLHMSPVPQLAVVQEALDAYRSEIVPILRAQAREFDNVLKVDASASSWSQKTLVCRNLESLVQRKATYLSGSLEDKPVRAYQVAISKVKSNIANTQQFCPVSLHLGFRDECPQSWEFSAMWKVRIPHYKICKATHNLSPDFLFKFLVVEHYLSLLFVRSFGHVHC